MAPQPQVRVLSIKTNPSGFQKKPLIVVVGKAVTKKAVDRNLVKRRISSIARPLLKKAPLEATIIARAGAAKASFSELKDEIQLKLKQ